MDLQLITTQCLLMNVEWKGVECFITAEYMAKGQKYFIGMTRKIMAMILAWSIFFVYVTFSVLKLNMIS